MSVSPVFFLFSVEGGWGGVGSVGRLPALTLVLPDLLTALRVGHPSSHLRTGNEKS